MDTVAFYFCKSFMDVFSSKISPFKTPNVSAYGNRQTYMCLHNFDRYINVCEVKRKESLKSKLRNLVNAHVFSLERFTRRGTKVQEAGEFCERTSE